jgi:hypothetical protein
MDIENYKKIADNEIDNPQWKLTKQYLEVNEILKINNEYIYERYSIHKKHGYYFTKESNDKIEYNFDVITFYYKIKKYEYFFCVEINIEKKVIEWIYMRNSTYCYLSADSENMTLEEMTKLTKLKHSSGATKGQKEYRGKKEITYKTSWVKYRFTNETSFEIEEALNMLLDKLENDKEGIKTLAKKTNANIVFCKYQYVSANAGMELDIKTIARLNDLNLGINIDMYCEGEYIK